MVTYFDEKINIFLLKILICQKFLFGFLLLEPIPANAPSTDTGIMISFNTKGREDALFGKMYPKRAKMLHTAIIKITPQIPPQISASELPFRLTAKSSTAISVTE